MTDTCRLCGVTKHNFKNLLSEDPQMMGTLLKINQIFRENLCISSSDNLSKYICLECEASVERFYDFFIMVQSVQKNILSMQINEKSKQNIMSAIHTEDDHDLGLSLCHTTGITNDSETVLIKINAAKNIQCDVCKASIHISQLVTLYLVTHGLGTVVCECEECGHQDDIGTFLQEKNNIQCPSCMFYKQPNSNHRERNINSTIETHNPAVETYKQIKETDEINSKDQMKDHTNESNKHNSNINCNIKDIYFNEENTSSHDNSIKNTQSDETFMSSHDNYNNKINYISSNYIHNDLRYVSSHDNIITSHDNYNEINYVSSQDNSIKITNTSQNNYYNNEINYMSPHENQNIHNTNYLNENKTVTSISNNISSHDTKNNSIDMNLAINSKININNQTPLFNCNKIIDEINVNIENKNNIISHKKNKQKISTETITKNNSKSKMKSRMCEVCHRIFNHKGHLKRHMLVHNKNIKEYLCDICGMNFNQKSTLNTHRIHVHGKDLNIHEEYKCVWCGQIYKYKINLRSHLLSNHNNHNDKKLIIKTKYYCKLCSKYFISNFRLNLHNKIHNQEKDFQCLICKKMFTQKSNMKIHIMRKHNSNIY